MFLSDSDIKKAVTAGDITINDFDLKRLQPASYDILLGNNFILSESHSTQDIDPARHLFPQTREIEVGDDDAFIHLHPGVRILGTTWDYVGSKGEASSYRNHCR